MFEITDETDKFTGERQINAILQVQDEESPKVQFSGTIAGHEFPEFAGSGSYHFLIEWENAKEIDGLVGVLSLAPEVSTMEFNLFYCLLDGKPIQFEHTAISKRTALTDETNETLLFIVSVTAEELKKISAATNVEFKASEHEFILSKDVIERIRKLLPLMDSAKTVTQISTELHERAENDLKSMVTMGVILGLVGLGVIIFLIISFLG